SCAVKLNAAKAATRTVRILRFKLFPSKPESVPQAAERPGPGAGGRGANKACRQRPASPLWRSVNVVDDLTGEVLRNPPQLLIGNHAAQALRDSCDARHFPGRTHRLSARRSDVLCFSSRAYHRQFKNTRTGSAP